MMTRFIFIQRLGFSLVGLLFGIFVAILAPFSPLWAGPEVPAPTPPRKVDIGAFVKELMKLRFEGDRSELALWFPYSFLIEANLAEGGESRSAVEKDLAFIAPYLTFLVQCSQERGDGTSDYQPEKEVRQRAVLLATNGAEISPLDKVPPAVTAYVAALKAFIASEGDESGQFMHILVFPAAVQGKELVAEHRKDKLTLRLKPSGAYPFAEFGWHTPFDACATVPPCPKCAETQSPKWNYCPFCGAKGR